MRLDPVILRKTSEINEVLSFYMGRNTPERQIFIIDNLRLEQDLIEQDYAAS
jgi:topoisomerase-4 subunit B